MAQLAVDRLSAFYGPLRAVNDLSTGFEAGSRTGIFGHNGSGKSTLLKCLVGGVKSVEGSVRFEDAPMVPGRVHENVRHGIGLVPQSRNVFPGLSVEQGLRIEVADTMPALEYIRQAAEVPGIARAIEQLEAQNNPALVASAVEFVLEGLHLNRKLNKERTGGRFRYRS